MTYSNSKPWNYDTTILSEVQSAGAVNAIVLRDDELASGSVCAIVQRRSLCESVPFGRIGVTLERKLSVLRTVKLAS